MTRGQNTVNKRKKEKRKKKIYMYIDRQETKYCKQNKKGREKSRNAGKRKYRTDKKNKYKIEKESKREEWEQKINR